MPTDAAGIGAEAAVETAQIFGVGKECQGCSEDTATNTAGAGAEVRVGTTRPFGVRGEF